MTICHCPGACDCLEAEDDLIQAEWSQWDSDRTPKRLAGVPLSSGDASQPYPRLVPSRSAARLEQGRAAHLRDERAARAHLYPVGDVIALPTRVPLPRDDAA